MRKRITIVIAVLAVAVPFVSVIPADAASWSSATTTGLHW